MTLLAAREVNRDTNASLADRMLEAGCALVNVGCAQSSGSTALSYTLDRHPAIACGAELFLFCHPLLYDDYGKFVRLRHVSRRFGVSGFPYGGNRAIFHHLRSYGLSKRQVWRWAQQAADFSGFASRLHEHLRALTGKPIWAEKTPWNIRVIAKFLAAFPAARVIHLVRDPRDVILSLRKRNAEESMLPAAENWLTSVAAVAPVRERSNLLEVRYEDLCTETDAELARICAFLGVPFDPAYFRNNAHASRGLMRSPGRASWDHRPSDAFSYRPIRKHARSGIDWRILGNVRLSAPFAAVLGTRQWTISELANTYGYDVPESPEARSKEFRPCPNPRPLDPLRRTLDRALGMPRYMTQLEVAGEAI